MKRADELAHELRRLGMFPAAGDVPYLRALVQVRGEAEIANLKTEVDASTWSGGLSLLQSGNVEAAVCRACGFGALLTEFLVAPLALEPMDCARVASLGARVNLIVSLYDNYVDQGIPAGDVLPESMTAGPIPLMPALVTGYYARLGSLPAGGLLHRAIARMRDAEDRVAKGENASLLWRRKCGLPWVVMGMGGWGPHRGGLPHLAWLYRVGCFLGWIDDAADVERDATQDRANRFRRLSRAQTIHIAQTGGNLLKWWDHRCRCREIRDVFRYCVNSWIDSRPR